MYKSKESPRSCFNLLLLLDTERTSFVIRTPEIMGKEHQQACDVHTATQHSIQLHHVYATVQKGCQR